MYSQVDAWGYVHNMMEAILGYRKYSSFFDKEDIYITNKSSQNCIR